MGIKKKTYDHIINGLIWILRQTNEFLSWFCPLECKCFFSLFWIDLKNKIFVLGSFSAM